MRNTIVYFTNGAKQASVTPSLWQWDYGQKLFVRGLSLPGKYEVHFCGDGDDEAVIATGYRDGIDVPDRCLESGKNLTAYIYLHGGESDGRTEYVIRIPVRRRPMLESQERAELIAEPEGLFDCAATLDGTELRWAPLAYRAFDHERCPRAEDEGALDMETLFDELDWDPNTRRPNGGATPRGIGMGALDFEAYADESYRFITHAGRNAPHTNTPVWQGMTFRFTAELSLDWAGTANLPEDLADT